MITCKKTDVKASPFKIADDQTPIISIVEQNNFTNKSLHIIGQQLNRIEEKIVEKTLVSKTEKPLIDLPSQNGSLKLLILSDLKVKTKGTSTSAARTISRNEKEIVSDENTDSDSLSFVSAKKVFDDDLP